MQLPAGRCTWFLSDRNLANGRTIWDWAILLGLAVVNPFDKVRDFDIPDRGHVPWPSWVVDQVRARLARPGADGEAWHHDMPARQRSHPHRPGAPRPQRPMVPSEEKP